MKSERALKTTSGLIKPEYTLLTVLEAKKPLAENAYLLAKSSTAELKIQNTESFAQIIKSITSQDEALELVRLLTSQELRPFLRDVYYTEVHKKANNDDLWFAIEPAQYDQWQLHDPVVTEENGIYIIERFVACYPRLIHKKAITQAKLIKIREWVSPEGNYATEIQQILAEGEAIRKILLFTK